MVAASPAARCQTVHAVLPHTASDTYLRERLLSDIIGASAVMGLYDYLWRAEEMDREVTERLHALADIGPTPSSASLFRVGRVGNFDSISRKP
jgi:hypothetical protein